LDYVETKTYYYFVFEFVTGGDLKGYINKHKPVPEADAKEIIYAIIRAMHYCHV